uniref:Ubiquitin carboxyl-terminal hydrolase n=2 Tax=Stegastes partitus TaxID=144197 RepID=A0A3B4ZRB6_9TELE
MALCCRSFPHSSPPISCLSLSFPIKKKGICVVSAFQNMSDAMAVLHKLQTGLDVNVKFTGVRVFEYTPECIVFDLLDIPLYHGWLVDPQMHDIVKAVGNCSYNQLVEKIISCKQSDNSELAGEGECFLFTPQAS